MFVWFRIPIPSPPYLFFSVREITGIYMVAIVIDINYINFILDQ